jgi:predicted O-methyltransferase YrrM
MGKRFRKQALDLALAPAVWLSALVLRSVRRNGVQHLPRSRRMLERVGVFPLLDHYYEPLFRFDQLRHSLRDERALPGIDWNEAGQLALLESFQHTEELRGFPQAPTGRREFHFGNQTFLSGDAELLYHMIRHFKPRRIIEIGCGSSTLMALAALRRNAQDNPAAAGELCCVEPYETPWLEELGVRVLRQRVEEIDPGTFAKLERNDLLFIDSSHMIRPQGDVLYEILNLLPRLQPGVIVHVHDIFSPRDYLDHWLKDEVKFWNEQYLLEAFLSCNDRFRILAAANFLKHRHYDRLAARCPFLTPDREPGSFYFVRN